MKTFVHTLITVGTLVLASVASADEKAHVITGRVVTLSEYNIEVQSGTKRLELVYSTAKHTVKPKVRDTVRVYYTTGDHARFDPDGWVTKIEVIAPGGSKK